MERNDVLLTAVDMKDAILACSVKNFAVCALLKVRAYIMYLAVMDQIRVKNDRIFFF